MTTLGAEELTVERSADGVLTVEEIGHESQGVSTGASEAPIGTDVTPRASAPGACSDGYYDPHSYKWFDTLVYSINPENLIGESIGYDAGINAVRRGGANITTTNTNCSFGDVISATIAYDGTTYSHPDIGADGSCQGTDGKNVVAFGDLPNSDSRIVLGLACTYYGPLGGATETNIKFNVRDAAYTTNPNGSNCSNKYGLEALATHEFGHSFGLGHADPEDSHTYLTMSPMLAGPCLSYEDTLGRGDILGLGAKY